MSHGIGLFAQIKQSAGYTSGDVQKCKFAHLLRGFAKTLSTLPGTIAPGQ